MSTHENHESGSPFELFTLGVAAIAIFATAVAILLMPAHATSELRGASDETYAGPAGYMPAEYVNQAREIEPMPEMYY